jgi:hypothetical protein
MPQLDESIKNLTLFEMRRASAWVGKTFSKEPLPLSMTDPIHLIPVVVNAT